METLRELKEARGKLYDKINEMNEKIKEINEKIKEIEIATAIVYCSDEKLREVGAPTHFTKINVSLANRNFFNEIVELLPDNSYICEYDVDDGYWTDGTNSGPCRTTDYLLMVNAKTAIVFKLTEKYNETGIKLRKDFSIEVYVGANNLKIRAMAEDFDGETHVVRIVDPNNNYEAFAYIVDGNYTLLDGQDVVDVIKTVDLTNFVIKDEEDYHIQKVKTTKETKQD